MNKSKHAAKKMLYFLHQILDAVSINKHTITKIVAILIFCGLFLLSNSFGIKEISSVANENPFGTDDRKSKLSM